MQLTSQDIAPYGRVAVKLLQGPVFDDQKELWEDLQRYQIELIQYFHKIGLELILDAREGYAFLRQKELDEKGSTAGLMRRISLTYEQTLVCVLLRDWLEEFERNDTDNRNLYFTPRQFRERLELFFKEKSNEVKFIRELNKYLNECESWGFVKVVHRHPSDPDENRYELKRIIKARISLDELKHFKALLEDEFKPVQH
jgi:hypothetical protein